MIGIKYVTIPRILLLISNAQAATADEIQMVPKNLAMILLKFTGSPLW